MESLKENILLEMELQKLTFLVEFSKKPFHIEIFTTEMDLIVDIINVIYDKINFVTVSESVLVVEL